MVGKLGAGIASDIYSEFRPSDAFGSSGEVLDRVSSGLNITASGLALGDAADIGAATLLMGVPGVDVVVGGVLIGTAAYATAELVWQHYGNDIKHGWHDAEHVASSGWHDVKDLAGDVGSFLGL